VIKYYTIIVILSFACMENLEEQTNFSKHSMHWRDLKNFLLVCRLFGSNNRDFIERHEREEEDKSRGAIRHFPGYRFASNFSCPFSRVGRCGWVATRQIIGGYSPPSCSFAIVALSSHKNSRIVGYVAMEIWLTYTCARWPRCRGFKSAPILLLCFLLEI